MPTTTALTCQCTITLHGSRYMSYALKADVLPRGIVSSICVSRVATRYLVAPLRKGECVNRYTHFSRNPFFCGWHTCVYVYFSIDGSSVMRLTKHTYGNTNKKGTNETVNNDNHADTRSTAHYHNNYYEDNADPTAGDIVHWCANNDLRDTFSRSGRRMNVVLSSLGRRDHAQC
ncbi:hypothetical protein NP493_284g01014 [Ridgeia piscesae]|uniref:Uncharacterized protein n=1 Tax=Ridgeia piscesae TaxID=27915 RepID=A0AAD9NX01_RIDPI|nr:hypothetical protein NP493_284g01014 [Ridgeia piscesae]